MSAAHRLHFVSRQSSDRRRGVQAQWNLILISFCVVIFTVGAVVFNTDVHKLVVDARLAVVRLDDDYALIPTPVADKIAERDANVVIYRADLREENKEKSAEDDWYADYEIPDDLTW